MWSRLRPRRDLRARSRVDQEDPDPALAMASGPTRNQAAMTSEADVDLKTFVSLGHRYSPFAGKMPESEANTDRLRNPSEIACC